ncbi:MAG TPA: AAA family ATPase [Candidatus Limnocylindrales bacterium]|nr:AAA family ATPase [Candidatus Limnocylindrales bacterium]
MTESAAPTRGTYTFLFTDIEGSTSLEGRIGRDRYAQLRERHRALLRDAWMAHGGVEQGTEGDSFFVVFPEASEAVAAAVDGQRALVGEHWPDDAPIRVRMGIHTGAAEQSGDSLVGLSINRTARIAAVAHGGQVLASALTRDLLADHPIDGIRLVDLGEHRLKDLSAPVRIVEVVGDGLPSEFPPLRTVDARPNNLPTQLTTFIGRDAELDEAAGLLATTRLLTLTGPGGTGKTRLSLQLAARAADDFPDGVFFVPLEPIRDPMLVAPRIASAVGVTETSARPIAESLGDWLRDKRLLLVLDNFEQVVSAAPIVAELLRTAPDIKAVVTSRAVLHVSGEQEYPVPGLPAPPDPSQMSGLERMSIGGETRIIDPLALGQYAAVRLFIERAVAVRPGFAVTNENAPAVAAISARLHGMPLAIELAAARIKILSPEAILVRLDQQLDVLAAGSRDLPARQQTLRGAIAWSYDLLDEGGRRLLDRLSVFASSCDLAAVEAICGPASDIGEDILDGLMALVDQSLLKVDEVGDGEPRFRLLDTIRAFAAERLEADGEVEAVRARHRDWFVAQVEHAFGQLWGADQRRWLDRLELEHDDIRAILDRAVAAPDPSIAIGVAFWMWRFWQKHGHLAEARRRLEAMDAAPWAHDDPRLRAKLLEALGGTCWWQGDIAEMTTRYREALAIWQSLGDEAELANAYYNASFTYAFGPEAVVADEADLGLGYLIEARDRFHALGDVRGEANAIWGIGNHKYFRQAPGSGVDEFRQTLEMFRSVGDVTMEGWSRHMLGTALLRNGDVAEARGHVEHAVRNFYAAGDASGLTLTLDDLSAIAVVDGDLPRAARLRGAARNLTTETGAQLAGFVEDTFETGVRPGVRSHMSEEDLDRYGAEGAAMTLDQAVAYALEGTEVAVHKDVGS